MSKVFLIRLAGGGALALLLLAGCKAGRQPPPIPFVRTVLHGSSSRLTLPSPHLATFFGNSEGALHITPAQAAPYLDFARIGAGPRESQSFGAAGIKVIAYTDINHYTPADNSGTDATLSMAEVAKTCSGQHVEWRKPNHGLIYLTDPRKPGTLAAWERWYASFIARGGIEWATFEDTSGNPYTYAYPEPPCASDGSGPVTQDEWTAAVTKQQGAMQRFTGKPIIFNGLSTGYNKRFPPQDALLDGPVAGGMAEVCAPANTTKWLNQIAIQIHAAARHKYFFCHNEDTTDGSTESSIAARIFMLSTLLMIYDPAKTVYIPNWSVGPSNLRVQPESAVVLLSPSKHIASPSDLLKAGGAYSRRYRVCWVAGIQVAVDCAVVVNPTEVAVPFPYPARRFRHTLALHGSGVFENATADANGAAPAPLVNPYSAEIAFP